MLIPESRVVLKTSFRSRIHPLGQTRPRSALSIVGVLHSQRGPIATPSMRWPQMVFDAWRNALFVKWLYGLSPLNT